MSKKIKWLYYHYKNLFRIYFNALMSKLKMKKFRICNLYRDVLTLEETHKKIYSIISDGRPALITRFGSTEAKCTADTIGINLGLKKHLDKSNLNTISNNAGVFPYGEKMALRFAEISADAATNIDLLGVCNSTMEDYLVNEVCPSEMSLTKLKHLEPYYSNIPWSSALKGKKVLVIHPFKDSIEAQYKKRAMLFEDENILPEFELKTLKAVQTIAGQKDERFDNWEEALNYMYNEAMKIDFDIAIIGCGAYGMPLGSMLKRSGKIAIHLGGATQILFGIKGARWDNHPISKFYNEHWIRPGENERPTSADKVEGACYW